ncbi:2,3-butanediol dehydrogenase [Nocardia sp. NPDC052254]|uniref:2,3-butanediol dehydrogenase n=1 Tax=Nocardia sp. NPDC052254 TaxID=3155681 RepID=UPI0034336D97
MKAVRLHGRGDLRIDDVDEPAPAAGQVKIRNAYVGICGSDLHVYFDPDHSGLDYSTPHPITGAMLPQILGHEFSGTVVELGAGVGDLEVGDRVAVRPLYSCGSCAACRAGMPNVCRTVGFHGLTSHGGGLAEYTTVAREMVHRLPGSVDLVYGALVEPMAVAWHAATRGDVRPGGAALIVGAGPIGIGLWFALRAQGIEQVIMSDPNPSRRRVAEELGVPHVLDPGGSDIAAVCADLTGGAGVQAAFDAAGVGAATTQALGALAPGGRIVIVAVHQHGFELDSSRLVFGELAISGVLAYRPEDFESVIAAMDSGVYSTTGWVDQIELEAVGAALHQLRDGRGTKLLVRI